MGRYPRAAQVYRQYLALDDRAPRVLYKQALAHYRSGQPSLAIDPLRRAVALDSRLVEAHYLLAVCLTEQKREVEAVQALLRALDINPAFVPACEVLARIDLTRGRTRDGIEQLEALAALEPLRPQRMVDVGLAYARLGRTEQAVMTLGRAADRYPDADVVYVGLGRTWLSASEAHHDQLALKK